MLEVGATLVVFMGTNELVELVEGVTVAVVETVVVVGWTRVGAPVLVYQTVVQPQEPSLPVPVTADTAPEP